MSRGIAQAQAQAARAVMRLATGADLGPLLRLPSIPDLGPRVISLQLLDVPSAISAPRRQAPRPAPTNLRTIASVISRPAERAAASLNVLAALVMDVLSSASDGWPQRISYGAASRQNVVQTALGFHVQEWGIGLAPISVDLLVGLGSNPPDAVAAFFQILYLAKRTRPLTDEFPKLLRWFDSRLNKTFVITQTAMSLAEAADEQGVARFRLEGQILRDYDNPGFSDVASSGQSAAKTVAAGLSISDFELS